jgi:hypothetical protein
LPIIMMLAGLTMFMSFAMLARQEALIDARYRVWSSANNNAWSLENLEGFDPVAWTPPAKVGYGSMPRGYGEELDLLRQDIDSKMLSTSDNSRADNFWQRLRDNLPGRSSINVSKQWQSTGQLWWAHLDHTATAAHFRDASEWRYYHLDAWQIARSGPLQDIYNAFNSNLNGQVFPYFQATRNDIMLRWWDTGRTPTQDPDLLANPTNISQ